MSKKILITGGTGSLGKRLVEMLAKNNKVVIYSRDEGKQASIFNDNKNILGMMPHPERMVDNLISNSNGIELFTSILK